jgi:AcrR family transcriptional regulator
VRNPIFGKLKPGPGRSREEVLASQRRRLQGALVALVGEHGYSGVTVRGLSRWAGVSTRTFYRHFANAEECFAATYESLMGCALAHTSASWVAGENWEGNLRAALRALMQDLGDNPTAAKLVLVESFAAGPILLERRRATIREFEQLLADSFSEAPDRIAVSSRVIEGIAAGVMRVTRTRLLAGRGVELPGIVDELADWVLSFRHANKITADQVAPVNGEQSQDRGEHRSNASPLFGDARGRILAATAKLAARDGYVALTVPRIRTEAGTSRRSFDAHFADVESCFLEAIEVLATGAIEEAEREARSDASGWMQGVCQASAALCAALARDPVLAQLGFIEVFAPGREGLYCRERLIGRCAERLRKTAPARQRPSELVAEASMAAAWRIVHAEIAAGRGRGLAQMAPLIAYVLLAPATGARRAAETIGAEQAAPARRPRQRSRLDPTF